MKAILDRREVLSVLIAWGTILPGCGDDEVVRRGGEGGRVEVDEDLLVVAKLYFPSEKMASAEAIGTLVLEALPEAERVLYLEGVLDRVRALLDQTETPGDAVEELRRRVRREFIDQQFIYVDGWILSRAETELCALAANERF